MADELSAPGGGAAVASAPVSAPVSTPSTTSAPATPAVTSTPAAPSPSTVPTRSLNESDRAYIERTADWRNSQPKEEAAVATGDVAPPEVKPAPVAEVKPVEPVKVEEKKEEPKPEVVKNPLDDIGPLPASKLAEALEKNPDLAAQLEAAGLDKDELFAGLREAAKVTQFRELGIPDVETAKAAVTAATQLYGLDSAATDLKPGDMQSTATFVGKLMEMSYLQNEDGSTKMKEFTRPDGSKFSVPETDGTVSTLLDNLVELRHAEWISQAQNLLNGTNEQGKEAGERALAAFHEVKQFATGIFEDAEGQSEQVKADRARLEADRAAFNSTKQQEANQRFESFRADTLKSTNETLDGLIGGVLGQTSLAPDANDVQAVKEQKEFIRNGVMREIRDKLYDRFNSNPLFKSEQEQIGRRGVSAGTQKALVNLYNRHANAALEAVAAPILAKAGAVRVAASKAKAAKIAAQIKDSTTEPRGTTAAVAPKIQTVDQAEAVREAGKQLIAELKRMPTSAEIQVRTKALIAKAVPAAV